MLILYNFYTVFRRVRPRALHQYVCNGSRLIPRDDVGATGSRPTQIGEERGGSAGIRARSGRQTVCDDHTPPV